MKKLEAAQMHEVSAGQWVWKPNLPGIQIGGGNTCQDVFNTYGGNANYTASLLGSGHYIVVACLNSVGGGGGNG